MSKESILIAEFMGVNVVTLDQIRANRNPIFSNADGYTVDELKYHSDWNWLMQVIESIDHLQPEPIKGIEDALATREIGGVYDAVVDFIKKENATKEAQDNSALNIIDKRHFLEITKEVFDCIVTNKQKEFNYELNGTLARKHFYHAKGVDLIIVHNHVSNVSQYYLADINS
tara:strand:+ start:3263 stop:3778 length:516 start_codon:yes stop_codon:yes gene_type:complete